MPSMLFTLLAAAGSASAAVTYKGCFSSSTPLTDVGAYAYQSSGYCSQQCIGQNQAVLATSNGTDCWCGGQFPASSSLVDDEYCSTHCAGYGQENCGGANYWSVYLTGLTQDVSNYGGSSSSSSSTSSSSSSTQQTATATSSTSTPSIVTSVTPNQTVVVTISASATSTPTNSSGSGGTSTAGIAAGVVVGIVAIASIIGGVYFFLRHRRRRQAEEDYKRSAQVSDFMRAAGGDRKAPNTAYSQMSDSRLDPEAGRRNSMGSIADDQDYSRRILRVANPDSH